MTLEVWFSQHKRTYPNIEKYYIKSLIHITQIILVKQNGKRIRLNYANVNSIEEI